MSRLTTRQAVRLFPYLITFTCVYMLAWGAIYLAHGNWEFLTYLVVVTGGAYLVLTTVNQTRLSRGTLWAISIAGLIHLSCGFIQVDGNVLYEFRIWDLYDGEGDFYILKMDQVVHFYGYGLAAVAIHEVLSGRIVKGSYPGMILFLSWTGSLGISAINEVMEYLASISYAETNVGDMHNMGLDLIANTLGAALGTLGAHFWWNKKREEEKAEHA
jgi:putative membrane protein